MWAAASWSSADDVICFASSLSAALWMPPMSSAGDQAASVSDVSMTPLTVDYREKAHCHAVKACDSRPP